MATLQVFFQRQFGAPYRRETVTFLAVALCFVGIVGGLFAFTYSNPPQYAFTQRGPALAIETTARGNTVVTTQARRYEVEGIWSGVVGTKVVERAVVDGVGSPHIPPRIAPTLCFADGQGCVPIVN